jgi:hypothetical protein
MAAATDALLLQQALAARRRMMSRRVADSTLVPGLTAPAARHVWPSFSGEVCREEIDPDSPGTVKAVKLERADTFRQTGYVEGMGALFHEACWPLR